MLYKGIFSVYSEDLKEIINVFCGNNGKLLNHNASGRYTDVPWSVKGKHNEMKLQKEQCTGRSEGIYALLLRYSPLEM